MFLLPLLLYPIKIPLPVHVVFIVLHRQTTGKKIPLLFHPHFAAGFLASGTYSNNGCSFFSCCYFSLFIYSCHLWIRTCISNFLLTGNWCHRNFQLELLSSSGQSNRLSVQTQRSGFYNTFLHFYFYDFLCFIFKSNGDRCSTGFSGCNFSGFADCDDLFVGRSHSFDASCYFAGLLHPHRKSASLNRYRTSRSRCR